MTRFFTGAAAVARTAVPVSAAEHRQSVRDMTFRPQPLDLADDGQVVR